MSLSPFEIRMELLKMSLGQLTDEHYANRSVIDNNWNLKVELAKQAGTPSPEHQGYPPFPTENEIIKKAEILNNFVSQSQQLLTEKTSKKST